MFEEVARLQALEERGCIQKVIIHAVPLSCARRSGGAGDRACHLGPGRQQLLADGGFSPARRRRNEHEERVGRRYDLALAFTPRLSTFDAHD